VNIFLHIYSLRVGLRVGSTRLVRIVPELGRANFTLLTTRRVARVNNLNYPTVN